MACPPPIRLKDSSMAQHLMHAYIGSVKAKSKFRAHAADRLMSFLGGLRGMELFTAKHAAECAVHFSSAEWTKTSLLTMAQKHASEAAVAALQHNQREQFLALTPAQRARIASVALLFDVDDTLAPLLQDTSFPGSIPAYPGLRPFVHRLIDRCAASGHVLRVGCLTARPGWMRWMAAAALRNALHLPEVTSKPGSAAAAAVAHAHSGHAGGMSPVFHAVSASASPAPQMLSPETRFSGLGTCDVLTGHLSDSLRLRSASRNTAIAATKSSNFEEFARLHPECVVVFCGDSGQGDAITAQGMQVSAHTLVRQDGPSAQASPDANWLCYSVCGVIHDIVPLTGSGHSPKTSALERATLRAKGVHVFDSYVEVAGVVGVTLRQLLQPLHSATGPVWSSDDTDAVAFATRRDMWLEDEVGGGPGAAAEEPPRLQAQRSVSDDALVSGEGAVMSTTAKAFAGMPQEAPAADAGSQAGATEAAAGQVTPPHVALHHATADPSAWSQAYTPIPHFKFSSTKQRQLRARELEEAEMIWCSWGGGGAHCEETAACHTLPVPPSEGPGVSAEASTPRSSQADRQG